VLIGFLAVSLYGCANFNTVDRSTDLPDGGKAVHLDAPQRVAIADKLGKVCAEPSPDALQAYASSLGAGLQPPNAAAISIAQALSTNAGSIGLRTQSITLMRDALYRICEEYKNGSLSRGSVHVLMERYQDLTMGILAIEQLTGAVAAPQVTLSMKSAATSAAEINSIQRELDKAKADENAKKAALESAQTALGEQKELVAEKNSGCLNC